MNKIKAYKRGENPELDKKLDKYSEHMKPINKVRDFYLKKNICYIHFKKWIDTIYCPYMYRVADEIWPECKETHAEVMESIRNGSFYDNAATWRRWNNAELPPINKKEEIDGN